MSSPDPAATPRSVRILRIVVIVVLAGGLALAAGIGIGRYVMGSRIADVVGHSLPDDGWADGATRTWEAAIAPDAEVFSAGGRLIAVTRARSDDANATLTAYTIEDDGLSEAWSTTADLSRGTTPGDLPEFIEWGEGRVVHGSTVIDLADGGTSPAPWADDELPMAAGDTIIACSVSLVCRAWRADSADPVWTVSLDESGWTAPSANTTPVYQRGRARYVILALHDVVNLDTGERVEFDLPASRGYYVLPASNGWLVHIGVNDDSGTGAAVYAYDLDGGRPFDSYPDTLPAGTLEHSILARGPHSRSDYRSLWGDGDRSLLLAAYSTTGSCIDSVDVPDVGLLVVPTFSKHSEPGVVNASVLCAGELRMSTGGRVIMGLESGGLDPDDFLFLLDAATGEQIAFEGVDVAAGGRLEMVEPGLVLGYDPATGTVSAFAPAGGGRPAGGPDGEPITSPPRRRPT